MKKLAIVTATRAEFGLLLPLIRRVRDDPEVELELLVTGTHLSQKHGATAEEIRASGVSIAHEIPILEDGNSAFDVSVTMANALKGFAECFRDDRPDMLVILGDRTEMLAIASAAMNERIPIAHIHGGEVTEGAVDDCVRHALTKMSYLHFTAAEPYRKRVIQLGEAPERVFNAGALGAENILREKLFDEATLRREAGLPNTGRYAVVTYHPVTLESASVSAQAEELCAAMEKRRDVFFLITAANADTGGDEANAIFRTYCERHENGRFVTSLGMRRYLSAVKYAAFVLGNSSSGILEAPVLGTPTVNIGDRQKGRLRAASIIDCLPERDAILRAMSTAESMAHEPTRLYGDGSTSEKILATIKAWLLSDRIDLKKGFCDIL